MLLVLLHSENQKKTKKQIEKIVKRRKGKKRKKIRGFEVLQSRISTAEKANVSDLKKYIIRVHYSAVKIHKYFVSQ